jgi:hypothetical protein
MHPEQIKTTINDSPKEALRCTRVKGLNDLKKGREDSMVQ